MSLWKLVRQNLSLKIISLIAAVILYAYVQQERNPTTPRTLLATINFEGLPEGYEVVTDNSRITVTVSGPREAVVRLKDSDIKAFANVATLQSNRPPTQVRIHYDLPKNVPDLVVDAASEFIKVQIFRQKTRKMEVTPIYKKDAPPGLKYGAASVRPAIITIRGREDRVNRVDKIVANASPDEPKASIDGDFSVSARDSDNNTIEGLTLTPDSVHVTVPQTLEPFVKDITVSLSITDQVQPPYHLVKAIVTPNQVQVIGPPARVNAISTISTEDVSIHDLTADETLMVNLITRPDVTVRDMQGRLITRVKAQITISKSPPTSVPNNAAPPPPRRDTVPGQ